MLSAKLPQYPHAAPSVRPSERTENEIAVASTRAALGEERWAAAWAHGRAMTTEEVVRYALSGDEGNGRE